MKGRGRKYWLILILLIASGAMIISGKKSTNQDSITCSISIDCIQVNENRELLTNKTLLEYLPENGMILEETPVRIASGSTVYDVLKQVTQQEKIPMEAQYTPGYGTYYIEGIGHLYEMDAGDYSGWMYEVNDTIPEYGCSSYTVEDGDVIHWYYTCGE
ncbi:MAG: DUF4430 domain-containing protein [Lachnospiraceae bacterium]